VARHAVRTTGGTLVLDCEGLSKLAAGDQRTRAFLESARERGARVVVSAITLAEALRGGSRDAATDLERLG
jgi:predicted nucleic acid-binding protein